MSDARDRQCGNKRRHASRRDALGHLFGLVRRGASKTMLGVYRCGVCGSWHVGHRKIRKR
ncbi:hypothetical protein AB0K05_24820 [Nonomuraea sp. NPDC049486]|uniref:hypothetical protein n=1 Tax=Nonomuraea sp. NPDC049486 TaxID=3155773 RepID=UPI003443E019